MLWGTESWGQWIAMDRYYETAPIPLLFGWIAHQLPHGFHVVEQAIALGTECIVPFMFLMPRRIRRWAFIPAAGLQCVIALTASYGSFNLVSALLCLWLLDDSALRSTERVEPVRSRVTVLLAGALMTIGLVPGLTLLAPALAKEPVILVEHALAPWHMGHAYHLFANVTLTRPAVFVQTSDDGETWETHFMRNAPGPPGRAPPLWLAPHHPRVDFQMWFFGLSPRMDRWHARLLQSMCSPSSPARALFVNPPEHAPRFVQFVLTEDHMTDFSTENAWWQREAGTPFSRIECAR